MVPILRPEWYCPNCATTAHLPFPKPGQTHLHTCPGLRGLAAPLVPVGTRARVYIREREDYVGTERVQLDPERGRPVMAIVTERADGSNDALVLAPTATATARS